LAYTISLVISEGADFPLPCDETDDKYRRTFSSNPSCPDASEEVGVCEAYSFAGVLPAFVCAKDVSDDKLKSSEVIVPENGTADNLLNVMFGA
jgi:hypothetical protein